MSNPQDSTSPDALPYRVLIVEDDRSQAVFAEAILRGAGMQTEVIAVPERVLEAVERFAPDLVLMDLHLPGLSGTELTRQIRALPRFLYMPVVFLTGDQDPDRQLEVLEHGGDDFILKPVRPRHLVVAVQSRIKRARALQALQATMPQESERHPSTGLYHRTALMQRLEAQLATGKGGALLLEMGHASALRGRYGYAAYETLMNDAGGVLAKLVGDYPAARMADNVFMVAAPGLNRAGLDELARRLRDGIGYHDFQVNGESLRLRCTVGYASYEHGFADAGAALAAAEEAAREAQASPAGIASYTPHDATGNTALVQELRAALAPGGRGLYLVFQPVVAVAGSDEAQFQVLLRMTGPDGSVRRAAEFLPAAQTAGLMPALDRWVMEQALDLMQKRRAEGRPMRLFVSQSPHTLGQEGYATWLRQALEARQLDGPQLVIDLRLEDAIVHVVLLQQLCEQLVPVGVQFCLSQFRYTEDARQLLQELPLGFVRLSAEFARHPLPRELRDEMRLAIDHAHRLALQVIAQAVEDPQAASALWLAGIDYIQGNLIQHPDQALDFDFRSATL